MTFKVKKISFTCSLDHCIGIANENADVFIEDNYVYTVVVATPKNIQFLMDKEEVDFFGPGHPFIIVKKLTEENDGYWLKFYQFADQIEETVFDQLKADHLKFLKE